MGLVCSYLSRAGESKCKIEELEHIEQKHRELFKQYRKITDDVQLERANTLQIACNESENALIRCAEPIFEICKQLKNKYGPS